MIAVTLRSMAQRKLRSVLTAVAILLGVAMIAGTYVQTDQIRTAMNDITRTANSGVDAEMSPRTAFTSTFGANDLIDQRIVVRASQVPGTGDVQGELFQTGSLVVDGRAVEPKFAPAIVVSAMRAPFDPLRNVTGRMPGQRGEVLVNRKLAEDEHLTIGQRVGVTTRTGIQPVRLVGIADYGNVASIGGATLIVAPMADVQAWYGLEGKVSRVVASAAPGGAPSELGRGCGRRCPVASRSRPESRPRPTTPSRPTTASAASSRRRSWASPGRPCSSARSSSSTPSRSPWRNGGVSSPWCAPSAPRAVRCSSRSAPRPSCWA
jgi:putative ABC transport system permease protein